MKNYKILENRPELTRQQILQGMSFSAVCSTALLPNALLLKSMAMKSLLLKVAAVAIVVTSSVLVYENVNIPPKENRAVVAIGDSISNKSCVVLDTIAVHAKQIAETSSSYTKAPNKEQNNKAMPTINPQQNLEKIKMVQEVKEAGKQVEVTSPATIATADVITNTVPFMASANVTCTIWNTNSFCNASAIDEQNNIRMECDDCELNMISCSELDSIRGMKAVWLYCNAPKGKFRIKTAFKNITLVRSSGEIVNPKAVRIGNITEGEKEPKMYNNDFKAKDLTVNFKKDLDIFLFFQDAKPGDKIFIDGFIQAEIKE
ncbi:MAG: hypothetical protein H0W61_15935 [Bacteroidetes bacterium]|nr:hypothetical protein [Bacteroidota bacterium]